MSLEKIKEIAEQMPDGPEKQQGLQAYSNLKKFEVIADSFESVSKKAARLMKPTCSTYIYFQLYKVWPKDEDEFEITSAHYTAKGMMAHITDKTDGQEYIMEIYPNG